MTSRGKFSKHTSIATLGREKNRRTGLHFLLTNVAYEVFTEEIIPQSFMDETSTVFSNFMPVAPVVRLTGLPLPAGKQQGAITHQIYLSKRMLENHRIKDNKPEQELKLDHLISLADFWNFKWDHRRSVDPSGQQDFYYIILCSDFSRYYYLILHLKIWEI